ncbi:hypothetical protein SAMN05444000_11919 [Shimia gijangensis]|uniref:Phospholipase A2 n=1 Tax=Shimia gijangensis TaxID=1470563 RepID=A0A1M6PR66_9RHOB|nr:hypothetical protein [Shimia gijangensis]SHK10427.1 hypothetical protein SAMN05444000_11919 [Shimia gijangensis]
MNLLKFVILSVATAAPLAAQQSSDGFSKRVELMAHQRLERLRMMPETELAPFTTDGCSGGMSATWDMVARLFPEFAEMHMETPPWESCCIVHDRAYHLGGEISVPEASFDARLKADEDLRSCVKSTSETRRDQLKSQYGISDVRIDQAYDLIAASMFDAVRVGGGPCSGLTWRWGYGWPQCGIFADW